MAAGGRPGPGDGAWAGRTAGRALYRHGRRGRRRRQLRRLGAGCHARRTLPVRRRRRKRTAAPRPAGLQRRRLARPTARRRRGTGLWPARARPLGAARRPPLQPRQAPARPVGPRRRRPLRPASPGHGRRCRSTRRTRRRTRTARWPLPIRRGAPGPARQRTPRAQGQGGGPRRGPGRAPAPPRHPARRHGAVRSPRAQPDDAASRYSAAATRQLCGPGPPGHARALARARRHHAEPAAGPFPRRRGRPATARPEQPLGLCADRLARPRAALLERPPRNHACRRIPRHGRRAAWRRPGSGARRRFQPQCRNRPCRPHAVAARARQCPLLPPAGGRRGALRKLDRLRQQPGSRRTARRRTGRRRPAPLGGALRRRRLPLRPRHHARARRARPLQPQRRPVRRAPVRPAAVAPEVDRRALGPRPRWLPARRLSARLDGVERPVPRHHARLVAAGRRRPRGVRASLGGLQRAVPPRRPRTWREHQLHHRARWLHAARSRQLRPQAQSGQRRRQPRRPS